MEWTLQVQSLRQAPTQPVPISAYGCPLIDSCYLGPLVRGARVTFFAARVWMVPALFRTSSLLPTRHAMASLKKSVRYRG
jgi:hypothetical protein